MLSLGALIVVGASIGVMPLAAEGVQALLHIAAIIMAVGLALEGIGHIVHARDMQAAENEGAASFYRQVTQYGKSYVLRNSLLGFNLMAVIVVAATGLSDAYGVMLGLLLMLSMLLTSAFGRSLFFVLVIPTTMPGAFFWKNSGFVDHARETGLADAPQHGVAYERHHDFKVNELLKTLKENSIQDMVAHIKWIFGK
jgi:hypothetical protein